VSLAEVLKNVLGEPHVVRADGRVRSPALRSADERLQRLLQRGLVPLAEVDLVVATR
jgi:hypothetical protein